MAIRLVSAVLAPGAKEPEGVTGGAAAAALGAGEAEVALAPPVTDDGAATSLTSDLVGFPFIA